MPTIRIGSEVLVVPDPEPTEPVVAEKPAPKKRARRSPKAAPAVEAPTETMKAPEVEAEDPLVDTDY